MLRNIFTILALFLTGVNPLYSQIYNYNPPSNFRTIPKGSLVIGMDNATQSRNALFNLQAYGLVNYILNSGIPVQRIIRSKPDLDDTDMGVNAQMVSPSSGTVTHYDFITGPFVVDSSYASLALPLIAQFGRGVKVYKTSANVSVNVALTLTGPANIALLNDGGSQQFYKTILDSAGFSPFDYTVLSSRQLNTSSCFTFACEAGGSYLQDTSITNPVRRFVNSGGNFMAQYTAIQPYENSNHFISSNGITAASNSSIKIKNASHPFVQFDGSVLDAQGTFKSMTITSGIFLPNTYAVIQDNSGPGANYKAIVRKYGLTLTGGNVFYFAGQPASYDWSSNAGRNAYRMILNAIMMPAAGSQVCSAADIEIKASLNKPEFCLKDTMSLLLIARNMGKKQATNVSIKNSVPSGLITIGYSSTHGTYSPSGKTWTIPVIQPGISDTLMIHYFLPVTGLISSSLFSVGNLLDLNRLNDTARVSFQVNPLPVINAGLDTALCLGSQLRLGTDSIAGNLYSWTSGSGTFNSTLPRPLVKPLVSTTFLLHKKTIASGCQTSDSVRVHINPVPVFDLGQDRNLCAGDTLRISLPDGAGMVSGWNSMPPGLNGSSGTLITVPSVSSTLYLTKTLTATGCHTTDSILISLSEPPSISVAGADSGTYHANASLTANVPVTGTGTWMILEGGGNIENIHAPHTRVNQMPSGRNVFVWMISNGACKASADEVVIQVKDLNIPQGFSPNGDGVNEAFEVEGILEFPESRIEIFNRWGIMVFSKDRYDNSWRGENHHGEKLPDDTYYYVISIDDRKYKSYLVLKR